jgi:ABC-type nitrate/sulfonate/bicarbonate transport system permease component
VSGRSTAALGVLGAVLAILAWGVVAELADKASLVGPRDTLGAIVDLAGEDDFWSSTLTTLVMAVRGLLAATVVGVLVGLLIGSAPWAAMALQVPVAFLRPIPPIVILPIVLLVMGPTQAMGETLIFYGCVLPIAVTTANGVRETDPVAIQTARSFGLSRLQVLRRVTVPSTAAFVGTAVRISLPHAFVIAVVAGYLGGAPGLGNDIVKSVVAGDSARLFAVVVVLGWMALLVHEAGHLLERRLLHWHTTYRSVAT